MSLQVNSRRKVLIIYDSVSYFIPLFMEKGAQTYSTFKDIPLILKILRRIYIILHLPLPVWYGDWKKNLADCDLVILFETEFVKGLINYIHNNYPGKRQILWYWNPVIRSLHPKEISGALCEKWTFDQADCKKFGMRSNTTFYFDNIVLPQNSIKYDIFFLGSDKGRRTTIEQLETKFREIGLNFLFYIVDYKRLRRKILKKDPPVPYQQALFYLSQSRAILDILPEGQSGASLRTMESIFLSKKLVTNDKKIVECDFYHPDNVFILNSDKISDLPFFLNLPYHKLPATVVAKYEAGNWLERFFE